MNADKEAKIGPTIAAVIMLVWLTFLCGIGYAAIHFVRKFW